MLTAISPENYYACKSEEPNVLAPEVSSLCISAHH